MSAEEILAALLARLPEPDLPRDLWTTAHIGQFIHRSAKYVSEEICCLPTFPRPYRLPVAKKGHALYKAAEVRRWVESCRS